MGRRRRAWLLLFAPVLAGCGTVASFALGGSGVPLPPGTRLWPLGAVYCGVALDVQLIRRGTPSGGFLAVLDLPLSLALDTALLPLTLPFSVGVWLWDRGADAARPPHPSTADTAPVGSG